MFTYKIFGALSGSREGLLFHSCVPDLARHPELWADECPFPIASPAHAHVELVNGQQPSERARPSQVSQPF